MSESERAIEHRQAQDRKAIGFWIYLMTDCILFATLFATFGVLMSATAGGPAGSDIFSMPYILVETMLLLVSSFTAGIATITVARGKKKQTLVWLALTFLLGAAFLAMELYEFNLLVSEGHSWQTSAFLSSYFTLVGTHGLHITAGLLWLVVLFVRLVRHNFKHTDVARLSLFSLFWHFLDIIWIFIFSFVYLIGGMA